MGYIGGCTLKFELKILRNWSLAAGLLGIVFLPSCKPSEANSKAQVADKTKSEKEKESDTEEDSEKFTKGKLSVPISGASLVDTRTARARCNIKGGATSSDAQRFVCVPTTIDTSGNETIVGSLHEGITISWKEPVAVEGDISSVQCSPLHEGLRLDCNATLTGESATLRVEMDLTADASLGGSRGESFDIIMPYSVGVVAGLVDAMPTNFRVTQHGNGAEESTETKAGFQQVELDPLTVPVKPGGMCTYDGSLYFASERLIYRLSQGKVTLFMGSGNPNNTSNLTHRLRTYLGLNSPNKIACSPKGLFVYDSARILFTSWTTGEVTTVVPSNSSTISMSGIAGLAADSKSALYITNWHTDQIFKATIDGTISVVAGTGASSNSTGDGGPAISATLNNPSDIVIDSSAQIIFNDASSSVFRKISTTGTISTLTSLSASILATDTSGNSYTTYTNFISGTGIKKIASDGTVSIYVTATSTLSSNIQGLSYDESSGQILVSDWGSQRIFNVASDGTISALVGEVSTPETSDPMQVRLKGLTGVATQSNGVTFIANSHRILKLESGVLTTVAGTGTAGFSGDNGPAASALISNPQALALANDGSLYFSDSDNFRIRKISPNGIITTVAGTGVSGSTGNGGAATSANIHRATSIIPLATGGFIFSEYSFSVVRKVDASGMMSVVAGGNGAGFSGDGGAATAAMLKFPSGLALASDGSLYISDSRNYRVRKVSPAGTISTVAGTGTNGYSGDGGSALAAKFGRVGSIALDEKGNLFVSDPDNSRVRVIRDGIVTTFFGQAQQADCGAGVVSGDVQSTSAEQKIESSLSVICALSPGYLSSAFSCEGSTSEFNLTFTNGASIVSVRRACHSNE